jgi:hypothetical protein
VLVGGTSVGVGASVGTSVAVGGSDVGAGASVVGAGVEQAERINPNAIIKEIVFFKRPSRWAECSDLTKAV